MKTVTTLPSIPAQSVITDGFGEVHFHDTFQIQKRTQQHADEIRMMVMEPSSLTKALLRLRNSIVGIFGLKTGKPDFPVISKSDDEVVFGVSDKHLDFRGSFLKDPEAGTVSLTTVVHFNNVWGRIYFLPVKPFHKMLMKTTLRRYLHMEETN